MNEIRAVPLDSEQRDFLEELGFEFMRAGEQQRATKLLAICLAWKVAPAAFRKAEFHCDIDESVGMADVVELRGYSRKVPCA